MQSIIYSRRTLTYLDSVRNLGLHADRQLNWGAHVSLVIKRVYCTIRGFTWSDRLSFLYFSILAFFTYQVYPVSRFIGNNLHSTLVTYIFDLRHFDNLMRPVYLSAMQTSYTLYILDRQRPTSAQCYALGPLIGIGFSQRLVQPPQQLCETTRLYTVVFVFGTLSLPLLKLFAAEI
jgi:hypothetical protein